MDKSQCCNLVRSMILEQFESVVKPSHISNTMGLADLLIDIKHRKRESLTSDQTNSVNMRMCEIALNELIWKSYDDLHTVFCYLDIGKSFHEVLYEIVCKKL